MRIQKVIFHVFALAVVLSLLTAVWGRYDVDRQRAKSSPPHSPQDGWLELVSIPLPGGGATLLRVDRETATGKPSVLLIDSGPPWSGSLLAARLQDLGIGHVDALFLTSSSQEQVGGAPALSGRIGIRRIYRPSGLLPEEPGLSLQTLLSGLGGSPIAVAAGDELQLGPFRVRVLAPHPDEPPTPNVLLIEIAGNRLLYMASSSADAEERLLARYGTLPAHVLFVADGGSRNAARSNWLAAVQPKVAIIQDGSNGSLERPAAPVLDRLERSGIQTYLPGREGILCLRLANKNIQRCPVTSKEDQFASFADQR